MDSVETCNVAVVQNLAGPTFLPVGIGDVLALIVGVQVLADETTQKAFEASKIGYLMSANDFLVQPISIIKTNLNLGLSVEAKNLLLGSKPKAAVRKLLEEM